jgi:hypothetical protein
VSVPGVKAQLTRSTATWPPKRMVRFLVSSIEFASGNVPIRPRQGHVPIT